MDASEWDESSLWLANNMPGKMRSLEQVQPKPFAIVKYTSTNSWKEEVAKVAGSVQQITIEEFESSLDNFKFADDIVMKYGFNWRFAEGNLILERRFV